MKIRNTGDLRGVLLEAIDAVRTSKMTTAEAMAISTLSARVIQSAQLDLKATQFAEKYNGAVKKSTPLIANQKEVN